MPIAVISPAKALDVTPVPDVCPTEPDWSAAHTSELLQTCEQLSKQQIKSLMSLSDPLASLNHDRFQRFSQQEAKPAAWAFDGPAHKALDIASLSQAQQDYAQKHVLTLSGLYGCLRPRDCIRPYRLEMGTKLKTDRGSNLYDFWADTVAQQIKLRLEALPKGEQFVVNVASEEYWGVIGKRAAAVFGEQMPVYTIKFPGPSVYAKQARGLFCRFMCHQAVSSPEQLDGFGDWTATQDGAVYKLSSSKGRTIEFARTSAGAGGKPAKKSANKASKSTKKAAPKKLRVEDPSESTKPTRKSKRARKD